MKLHNAKLMVGLMTGAGVLALALNAFFLFLPTLRAARDLKAKIMLAQTELEAQYANRKHLLSSRAKIAETKETMKTLSAQFVPVGQELQFITAIEALASKNGVTERLQLSKNETDRKAPEFEEHFDLIIEGPYRATLQMLTDIEKLPPLMIVDSSAVRPGSGADGQANLSIDLHGSIVAPPKSLL